MKATSEKPAMQHYGYAVRDMTVGRVLADKAVKNGDKAFLHYLHDGRRLSYRDVDLQSNRIANGLLARGIARGQHVAVVMDNCPEQMLLYFALAKIGAVAVPVNTSARGKLLAYFLNQSDATAIVAEAEFAERITEVLAQAPAISALWLLGAPAEVLALRADGPQPHVRDFTELQEGADHAPDLADAPVRFSDLAMLNYTSGTTGASKASMLAQATVVQFAMTTAESHGYRFSDVVYVCLPINHSNAWFCLWAAIIADASVALSRRFSVSRYWHEIKESGATLTNLLGSMVNMLWSQPAAPDVEQHTRLRACVIVPVPKFALEWEQRFHTRVVSSYGLSDYVNATVYTLLDPVSKLGSAGRPRAGIELRIVDEDGVDVPAGAVGELLLRSNNPWGTTQGYYKMPEATVAATRNLWWHTGDMASVDEDGYLFFADRKKDALRRRGENISAQEVEAVIMEHPAVLEAAVYPLKSEMSEDEVAVSVLAKAGARIDEAELIAYCVQNMAHFMVPRFVHVADDLPRTQSQKVQKAQLRQWAEAHREHLWDRERSGIVVKR